MTVAGAAKTLGLRVPQVQGWAQNGHVLSCKHGRRRLVSLGTCREHLNRARLRERHARAGNPPRLDTEPTPAVVCEIVPVDVAGHQLVGARLDGQEVIAVRLLEELLGLMHGSLARKMRRRADFIEGVHMFNLNANQMQAIREQVSDNMAEVEFIRHASRITVLTAAGVSMALMLGDSDICRRLRQELSTSGFMQSVGEAVRDQDAEKFARTLTGDQQAVDLERFRADLLAETRQIVQEAVRDAVQVAVSESVQVAVRESMQAVVALLPELMNGVQATASTGGKQHRCNMRAETVARLVRQNVLGVKMTPAGVHDLARSIERKRLGLRNDGSGLEGFSELRNAGGTYDVWFYSPAMVSLISEIMRNGQIYMGFVQ
jgi:hypothetical protein